MQSRQCVAALGLVLFMISWTIPVQGQTTYTVTVAPKTNAHPWFGEGWNDGYLIDGDEGAVVTLVRGETYTFQMQNVPNNHPFYVSTSESGGGAGVWEDGVEGNFATGNNALTFTVPEAAPDVLYYQCSFHPRMGGVFDVVSGGTATESEELPAAIRLDQNYPNPFNPTTEITFALEHSAEVRLTVFDMAGRAVMVLVDHELPAGEHAVTWNGVTVDGTSAPSGTYLVRLDADDASASRVMTLIR